MPDIQIAVINKVPKIIGDIRCIVAKNSDYTIRFTFDEMWEDGEKTVYFVRENGFAFSPAETADDTVTVPVQNDPAMHSMLFVGVQQGNVKTSRPVEIRIASAITDMIDDDAVQPEPSMWEDVIARLEELEKSGVPADKIDEAVGDYLAKNPIESVKAGNALEMIGNTLNVITTDEAEGDNTLPITSAGVHTIVGNISAILDTI